jgi:hypothetical protein
MNAFHWNHDSEIENPRNQPSETIDRLRALLSDGATIREDRCRRDFFEVHDEDTVYYVYASPVNRKIYLVATWLKEPSPVSV